MMPQHVDVQPVEPPPLTHPSWVEQKALAGLAARVAALARAALAGGGVTCAGSHEPQAQLRDEAVWQGGWAAEASWAQVGRWRMLFSTGAAEAMLAAQLGQDELTEHPLTELDLRLLEGPVRRLAGDLGRELQSSGAPAEIIMSRGVSSAEFSPAVVWPFAVQRGGLQGEALLLTPWEDLRELLQPEPDDRVLTPEALRQAPVLVEAILTALPVTPRELLGMQPGDVLRLGAADRLSVVTANGRPFARGRAGAKGRTLAINIQHIEPPGEAT